MVDAIWGGTVDTTALAHDAARFVTAPPINAPHLELSLPKRFVTPRTTETVERRQLWQRRYRHRVLLTDSAVVVLVCSIAAIAQIVGVAHVEPFGMPWAYWRVSMLTAAIWLIVLALFQTRSTRIVGYGSREYQRVAHATGMAFGVLAIGFIVLQSSGIRMQLFIALPLGLPLMLIGRLASRRWLVRQRRLGEFVSRAIVVGRQHDVERLVATVHGCDLDSYDVVGVTLADSDASTLRVHDMSFRATGTMDSVRSTARDLRADVVIVASTPDRPDYLKDLSWSLEGTAAELILSSPLMDVAGPRMSLRPIEGRPLVHVEIPTFDEDRYLVKRCMDIMIASFALVFVGLLTPVVALLIKLDSPGTVFFRQQRVGRDGRNFDMVKFRSMGADAEARKQELMAKNEGAGLLFKMKDDPRVTRVGAVLRKYSLDELPQFWNVLCGHMSIVGPRPPLPDEVSGYDGTVFRRLYIKPGITGPWQVGGRSDLSWDESLRLDLRYVENWSVTTDVRIMWQTARVMLHPEGAGSY